jgi:dTDP-4-dehydrorhamnose 3,5-epimerase
MPSRSLAGIEKYSWSPHEDNRGRWQRVWDPEKFESSHNGLRAEQVSVSTNPFAGTLRGMHFLSEDAGEWKSVVCVQGLVQDVIVDMRKDSPTKRMYQSLYLDGKSNEGVLIPPGCAHGFLTLEPETILIYIMSVAYNSDLEQALRWDDPSLQISWDMNPSLISEKDRSHRLL